MKPVKSTILEKSVNEGAEWEIPAQRGVGFLMVFGMIFAAFPLLVICFLIFGGGEWAGSIGLLGKLGVLAFLFVFVMIGGGLAYFGYKFRKTRYLVKIRDGAVEVEKKFSQKAQSERLRNGEVFGVGLYESSRTNNKPNYGILVRARDHAGAGIKFGTGLKEDELRWLVSEMLGSLAEQGGLPNKAEKEEMYFSSSEGEPGEFSEGGVVITPIDNERFLLEKDMSIAAKGMLFGGLFGMVFSSIFISVGFWADNEALIFGIVGCVIAAVSLVVFVIGISRLGTSEKYHFEKDQVIKEKLRGGVSKGKIRFSKSDYHQLEVKSSGSSNEQPRYSVVLLGLNKKLKLFRWVPEDISEAVKFKVSEWLKGDEMVEASPVASVQENAQTSGGYGSAMVVDSPKKVAEVEKIAPTEVPIYSANNDLTEIKGGIWMVRGFFSIFLIAGVGLTYVGISKMMQAKASESWPTVKGVITKSEVSINSGSDSTTYGADVSYRYKVEGKKYKGDRVRVTEVSTSNRGKAQNTVKKYPRKKRVEVYYDPQEPETSVLETGISGGSWLLPGMGAAFLIIPLFALVMMEKHHKKQKRKKELKEGGEKMRKSYNPSSLEDRFGKVK